MGKGPALVIVHGSLYTGDSWLPVASLLSDRFTCCLIDRRGRGRSGDAPAYAIEREYEDVEGALGIFVEGVSVFGHSFGAVCALGAALRAPVARLILYEPPLSVGGSVAGGDLRAYQNAIAAGDPDAALEIGYTRFAGIPEAQVRRMRTSPRSSTEWAQAKTLAWTWTREAAEIDKLGPSLDRYRAIQTPTLLLLGEKSAPRPLRDTTEALRHALPHARLSELQDQGHLAHLRKPELVADRIREFLTAAGATCWPD